MMPNTKSISRRAMLGRIPAAALATTVILPAAAMASGADPIFPAIAKLGG
jgi:hypothetical protein